MDFPVKPENDSEGASGVFVIFTPFWHSRETFSESVEEAGIKVYWMCSIWATCRKDL